MLTNHAMNSRPIFTMCVALIALSMAPDFANAQASDVGVQGTWVYTKQDPTAAPADMAATASTEDGDVWLLLTCSSNRQRTVSIMDAGAFSYPLETRVNVALGIDAHPMVTMSALAVNDRQISLDPGPSYALLPLLLAGNQSFVGIADSRGETHRYSFTLQPNDIALSGIRAQCLGHSSK